MRIVGLQNRSEIELDPLQAYRRGRALDAVQRHAAPPIQRGVTRGSHEHFNRLDAERQKQAARALNAEKDLLDKQVLSRIRDDLKNDE
jgi:hypothetical protein